MEKYIEKADILLEALPYIQRFANKTMVINTAATPWKTRI